MNGAQTIIDTILENARDDAAHTLAQARDKAKKLHDAAEEGAKNRLDAALDRAESDAAQRRERSLRMEQLELRKAVLGQQRELIDQAFQGALEQLAKEGDYRFDTGNPPPPYAGGTGGTPPSPQSWTARPSWPSRARTPTR